MSGGSPSEGGTPVSGGVVVVVMEMVLLEVRWRTEYVLWKNGSNRTGVVGSKKGVSGYLRSASYMKSCQIMAGKLPPVTWMPCTLSIDTWASALPIQTAVARCGV